MKIRLKIDATLTYSEEEMMEARRHHPGKTDDELFDIVSADMKTAVMEGRVNGSEIHVFELERV